MRVKTNQSLQSMTKGTAFDKSFNVKMPQKSSLLNSLRNNKNQLGRQKDVVERSGRRRTLPSHNFWLTHVVLVAEGPHYRPTQVTKLVNLNLFLFAWITSYFWLALVLIVVSFSLFFLFLLVNSGA